MVKYLIAVGHYLINWWFIYLLMLHAEEQSHMLGGGEGQFVLLKIRLDIYWFRPIANLKFCLRDNRLLPVYSPRSPKEYSSPLLKSVLMLYQA